MAESHGQHKQMRAVTNSGCKKTNKRTTKKDKTEINKRNFEDRWYHLYFSSTHGNSTFPQH